MPAQTVAADAPAPQKRRLTRPGAPAESTQRVANGPEADRGH
jgi:hypothetical protein